MGVGNVTPSPVSQAEEWEVGFTGTKGHITAGSGGVGLNVESKSEISDDSRNTMGDAYKQCEENLHLNYHS